MLFLSAAVHLWASTMSGLAQVCIKKTLALGLAFGFAGITRLVVQLADDKPGPGMVAVTAAVQLAKPPKISASVVVVPAPFCTYCAIKLA